MIYFIRQSEDSFVKIGYTNNIKARLMELQTNNPRKLEILLLIDGDYSTELLLHDKFIEYKSHNEWFFLSDEIKEFIAKNSIDDLRFFDEFKPVDYKNNQLKFIRLQEKLNLRQMGLKLNMAPQSIRDVEKREPNGTISLNSLSKYAESLGYELKYRLIKKN